MTTGRLVAMIVLAAVACTTGPTDGSNPQAGTNPPAVPSANASTPQVTTSEELLAREQADRYEERSLMVEEQIVARGITDSMVLAAMRTVPRHEFVSDEWQDAAYEDHPLPIGFGQTISQPYFVALMSEALALEPGATVLEIGTGSGYQAAVLAEMGFDVFSIEIIPEIAVRTATTLLELGYCVTTRVGDGYFGWQEQAPFDGIMVTARQTTYPSRS